MTKFKMGDKVVRTNAFKQCPELGWPDFEEGKVYTVAVVSPKGEWLGIEGMHTGLGYDQDRFDMAPPEFKVGDRIVTTRGCGSGVFKAGCVGTVVDVDSAYPCMRVKFTSGDYDTSQDWWVDVKNAELAPATYASKFTESSRADPVYAGHAGTGGLQNHSVGGIYPWAVVAYVDERHPMRFTIENLVSGVVLCSGPGNPMQWLRAPEVTTEVISDALAHAWLSVGKVVFNKYGALVIQETAGPAPSTEEVMRMGYYYALEQDIG